MAMATAESELIGFTLIGDVLGWFGWRIVDACTDDACTDDACIAEAWIGLA
jgi:hypothetical protein